MESQKNLGQWIYYGSFAVLSTLCIAAMVVALHPALKNSVKTAFNSPYRKVLSVVNAKMDDNQRVKVVKVLTHEGLYLEVYGGSQPYTSPLIDRIKLPDHKDGYFLFRGHATNLAIDDVDGDKIPEIIAPSYDANLVAHLNVYRYNQDRKTFEPIREL